MLARRPENGPRYLLPSFRSMLDVGRWTLDVSGISLFLRRRDVRLRFTLLEIVLGGSPGVSPHQNKCITSCRWGESPREPGCVHELPTVCHRSA